MTDPTPVATTVTPTPAPVPPPDAAAAPGATPPTPPAPEPTPPEPKPDAGSKAFAALSRKERELTTERQKIAAEKAALQAERAELAAFKEAKKNAQADPITAMQSLGLTYEQATDYVLSGKRVPVNAELAAVKEEIKKLKEAETEKATQAAQTDYQKKQDAFLGSIGEFLEANKETYEVTATNPEAKEIVYNVMLEYWKKNKRVLSLKEAADVVEADLEADVKKYTGLKKFQPKAPEPKPAPINGAPTPSPTLTNHQGTKAPTPSTQRTLTREESAEEAAKLLAWR